MPEGAILEATVRFRSLNLGALYGYAGCLIFGSIYAGAVVSSPCQRGEPFCGFPWYGGVMVSALLLVATVVGPVALSGLLVLRGTLSVGDDYVRIRTPRFVRLKIPMSNVRGTALAGSEERVRLVVRTGKLGLPVAWIELDGPLPREIRWRLTVKPKGAP
ncbi:MAG: hypothetical protein L3K18_07705 [Thermoplasmata archaeon]|nr:hypothetical protein [Thermoplasmata archaeon]